ncbi:MAG: CobQ/CobB/MinD/ParA nucleotide binding domain protein [Candidatus Adlerbacteria bacterium]|nr:CobQ/CobB/MinD/ParA nucleotide binding domain protein [Candidatus Adlerbacteria bacterium]
MKVAFLGKGGSGKSTLATALVQHLARAGVSVLAIDADHNMDLSYNLGADPSVFLGSDPSLIKKHVGLDTDATFAEVRKTALDKQLAFHLSPMDEFTLRMTIEVSEKVRLMTAGPHTDIVRSGEHCSHSLAAPLKVYLPLLQLGPDEWVVIDERAGTDPVATGILAGVDLAVIVEEPTVYSQRVAKQIAHELTLAKVSHIVVHNKHAGVEGDTAAMVETVMAYKKQKK